DPAALAGTPLPEHVRLAARSAPADPPPADVELTAREIEVLDCLAAGMSNKQVARRLDISIRTVTVHVSNLLHSTRSASRTVAALDRYRDRLARAAAAKQRVLVATGHPTGLLEIHLAVVAALRAAGCRILTPAAGHGFDVVPAQAEPLSRAQVLYVGGVAM